MEVKLTGCGDGSQGLVCLLGDKFTGAENTRKMSQSEGHELGPGHVGVDVPLTR